MVGTSKVRKCLHRRKKRIEEVKAKCAEVTMEKKELISNLQLDELIRLEGPLSIVQFKEAENWAEDLDKKAKNKSYQRPPLFGVPISLKECIQVKGYSQTRGYADALSETAAEDHLLTQQLKELGCVPFVLTNVPQGLLSLACTNPIYGATRNTYKPTRTCGGSSGGEAALISSGGSIIGFGGDVGGSIRCPCHFSGITGFKPSHFRLSHQTLTGSVPGRPMIDGSEGPMARHAAELVTLLRIIWSGKWISYRDPYVPPVDWDEKQFSRKGPLRIGYYDDDGWFKPTPALQRAVHEAVSALRDCGYTMVKFEPPDVLSVFKYFTMTVTVDGGQYIVDKFKKDLIGEGSKLMFYFFRIPTIVKRVLGKLLIPLYPRIGHFLCSLPLDIAELRQTYEGIEKYRKLYARRMKELHISAIICPVQVVPAVENHFSTMLSATTSYTAIFNLLDFAAGTVNVTKVNEEDEKELHTYPESDPWYQTAKQATKGSIGLPVGVQVAAPPYYEETVLRIMCDIEQSLKNSSEKFQAKD
uniref:fatty acid amide hydrolase n=1 Tax=Setaria digitata TaxID=48799 RepID=A0A915PIN3_9BILA